MIFYSCTWHLTDTSLVSIMSDPSYRYTCWALASDWRQGHIILAANVDTIPSPPPRRQAVVMVDGLWGEHEWTLYPQLYRHDSPYLAWLRLSLKNIAPNILTSPVHKQMWQVHPNKPNIHFVDPAVFYKFKNKLEEVKADMQNPFHKVTIDTCFSHIISPKNEYA